MAADPKVLFFVEIEGKVEGPFSSAVVNAKIRLGKVTADTPASQDGVTYVPAVEIFGTQAFAAQARRTGAIPTQPSTRVIAQPRSSQHPQQPPPVRKPAGPGGTYDGMLVLDEEGSQPPEPPAPSIESVRIAPGRHADGDIELDFEGAGAQASWMPSGAANRQTTQMVERYKAGHLKHGDQDTITCPHCWTVFPLEDALYVARHPDLVGDPFLGREAPQRFKPSRFTPEGMALDPGGMASQEMACPSCHLEVPRSLIDMRGHFFSIIGAPASGKSYYLASLTWELRRLLSHDFGLMFTDAETIMNRHLNEYEELLFLAPDPDAYTFIRKTQEKSEIYSQVNFNGQMTYFPRPIIFSLKPQAHNPLAGSQGGKSSCLVLYDNAGENFYPGADSALDPSTMHMARSSTVFFIFDPTKDPRFRSQIHSDDPQVQGKMRVERQDVVLNEAARRMRRYLGLPQDKKPPKELVVIVSKYDIWRNLLRCPLNADYLLRTAKMPVSILDLGMIEDVSFALRCLLQRTCPELVVAAEDFSDQVLYVPVSALGSSPSANAPGIPQGELGVRPRDIKPIWASVPFLYALGQRGLLHMGHRPAPENQKIVQASLIQFAGGQLFVELPNGRRCSIPARLAGFSLHDPDSGQLFQVPKLDQQREGA